MKAILLSAGRGRRLARATDGAPKCLVPIHDGRSLLELQLRALARAGFEHATIMVGYGAERVESALTGMRLPGLRVATRFNPFSASSDNLVTAWLARDEMDQDFLLLNGDTLFEDRVLQRLRAGATGPATIAAARKARYDADDMKVLLGADGRLRRIGKALGPEPPDGEAIGMTIFRGRGAGAFAEVLDEIVRGGSGLSAWYTSALDALADRLPVQAVPIGRSWWAEVDTESDLFAVREALQGRRGGDARPGLQPAVSNA